MKNLIFICALTMALASCDKEKQECPGALEKTYALSGFNRINAGDAHHITITKGATFAIKASGCTSDLDDLLISADANQLLTISYKRHRRNRYRVDLEITLPALTALTLSGAAHATIEGFSSQHSVIRTVVSGASECEVNGTAINAAVEVSGASRLILHGATESLYGNISGASRLEAYGVTATEVDISVSGASKAWVRPTERFFADASGASEIYYKGNPATRHVETSGNGRVIQQ